MLCLAGADTARRSLPIVRKPVAATTAAPVRDNRIHLEYDAVRFIAVSIVTVGRRSTRTRNATMKTSLAQASGGHPPECGHGPPPLTSVGDVRSDPPVSPTNERRTPGVSRS